MSAAAAHALRALPDRRGPASRRAFAGILVLLLAGVGGGLQAPMAVASTTLPTPDPATQIPAAAPLGAAITFYGRGWGHGVGLAQYGARGRATAGQTYSQILAHYYLGTTLGAVDPATPVRVSVLSGWSATAATPLLIYGKLGTWSIDGQADTFPASASLTVAPPVDPATDWHLVVTAADGTTILLDTTVNTEFRVRPVDPTTVLQLYSKPSNYDTYRGVLRVLLGTTTVSVVNELPLESYLRGVIAAEMPASWPAAALWAQAIAARSYGKYQLHPSSGTFDVYDDTRSQVYHGILGETGTTDAAVAGTAGVVALYKGAVIDALFHSSDGGATEDSKNVFTTATGGLGATYPYLSGSSDLDANGKSYDATSPYENWQTATYPLAQLSAMFAADSRTNVGTLTALDLSHRGVSGRLIYVVLTGSAGTKQVSGGVFTSVFNAKRPSGDASMRSTLFDLQPAQLAPVASAPGPFFPSPATFSTTTQRVSIRWPAAMPAITGGTIASYSLAQSTNGGPFTVVATTPGTSSIQTLTVGMSYAFEVRATDSKGIPGAYAVGPTFRLVVNQNTAGMTTTGPWVTNTHASFSGGTEKAASAAGATVTFTFTGLGVAWVAKLTSNRGSAQVYLDGVLITTVNLQRSTTAYRQIVFANSWATSGPHTLKIVNVASSGHPWIDVDAVLTFQ